MVGAVEEALLGPGVGDDDPALASGCRLHEIVESRIAKAGHHDVAAATERIKPVQIDVGQRSFQEIERMADIVFEPSNPFSSAVTAIKRIVRRGAGLRRLNPFANASNVATPAVIIEAAIVNLVPRECVVAAQVVPVGCIDDALRLSFASRALKLGDDVSRPDSTNGALDRQLGPDSQRYRPKISPDRGLFEGIVVMPLAFRVSSCLNASKFMIAANTRRPRLESSSDKMKFSGHRNSQDPCKQRQPGRVWTTIIAPPPSTG